MAGGVAGGSWLVESVGASPQFSGADFSDDDRLYASTAEDFVRNEVLTRLEEIESKQEGVLPALLKRAGELGLLMIDIPERWGGLGLRKTTSMLVSERGALCASFSVSWGAHTGIGTLPLVYYGTDAQKTRYLPRLATGELLAAYALTEPGSGSDALAARTEATRSVLCVGIDPDAGALPTGFPPTLAGVEAFARLVLEAALPVATVRPRLSKASAVTAASCPVRDATNPPVVTSQTRRT